MIEKKRFFFVIPIILISLLFFYEFLLNNQIYLYSTIFLSFGILFWNLPFLITMLHTTPVYYEDIKLISSVTDTNIYDLQGIFSFLNGLFSTIFICIIIFYIQKTYVINDYSFLNLIGVIGGLFTFYIRMQAILGKCLLTLLFKIKQRNFNQNGGIEMVNLYTEMSSHGSSNSLNTMSNNTNSIGYMDDISKMSRYSQSSLIIGDLWRGKKTSPINAYGCSDLLSFQSLNPIQNS